MDITINNPKPDNTVKFFADDGTEVGKLDWNDGTLKFTGEADKSALIFIDLVKQYVPDLNSETTKE